MWTPPNPDDNQPQYPPALGMAQAAAQAPPNAFQVPEQKPVVFQTRQPNMTGPTPLDKIEQNYEQQREKAAWQRENPWGTANNHPGVGGKIAHVLSVAGNIAGNIFAPEVMASIPGSQLNRQMKEAQAIKGIEGAEEQKSKQGLEGAQAGHLTEETNEMPTNSAAHNRLENAQAGKIENPPAKEEEWNVLPNVLGPNGEPVEHEKYSGQIRLGDVAGLQQQKQPKPDTPEQQFIDEYQKLHPKSTTAEAIGAYTTTTTRPPQQLILNPAPNGGYTAQTVRSGSQVAPGAQTAAGVNAMNTPTMTQRTAAGRAQTVVEMAPEVMGRIDKLAPKIGAISGRWNEFMQGKVGMDDPEFAGLRSDLLMMSSAVALAHAQGRLPENLREEFDHAINAPNQTPENLKATINAMLPWLQKMQDLGKNSSQPTQGGAPPEGADVQVKGKDGKMYWGNSKTKQVLGAVQ